ncbi:MAG: hypothetical protein KBT06_08055 [Prevotellaceae bacterium]|nr:hypothetical protein [Candidatus Colivivens equi]
MCSESLQRKQRDAENSRPAKKTVPGVNYFQFLHFLVPHAEATQTALLFNLVSRAFLTKTSFADLLFYLNYNTSQMCSESLQRKQRDAENSNPMNKKKYILSANKQIVIIIEGKERGSWELFAKQAFASLGFLCKDSAHIIDGRD